MSTAPAIEVEGLRKSFGEVIALDGLDLLCPEGEVLARLGYEPVSFSDSHIALAAFEAAPERFDVVLTDEVMPGLTGTGLARVVPLTVDPRFASGQFTPASVSA